MSDDLLMRDGYAMQIDRSQIVNYDAAYFDRCAANDHSDIADAINFCRIALVARYIGNAAMLDIGIGAGAFVRLRQNTRGFDVNPVAVEWLKRNDLWAERIDWFGAVSFWDVLEHLPDPNVYLRHVQLHCMVFASIPVFEDLTRIRESKHYRPNEHLWYWTDWGFVEWMANLGFALLEVNDDETRAGRDSIKSFAFRRNRWSQSQSN